MITWPDLALPPINLWNAPRVRRTPVSPAMDRKKAPTRARHLCRPQTRIQALLALR